ncbi:MAG: hypothetical protein KDA86_21675 [Planctomycetaceae bacterium]|nr:hypothetical protein [Planctomycetaceae bacterium]
MKMKSLILPLAMLGVGVVIQFAEFVDVAAKATSSHDGEAEVWKHERAAARRDERGRGVVVETSAVAEAVPQSAGIKGDGVAVELPDARCRGVDWEQHASGLAALRDGHRRGLREGCRNPDYR